MKKVKFSYTRRNQHESFADGVAYKVPGGVAISMWGGENNFYFTTVSSQAGTLASRLTFTTVDSLNVPTWSWNADVKLNDGGQSYKSALRRMCREAATLIGEMTNEESVERIARVLFKLECNW